MNKSATLKLVKSFIVLLKQTVALYSPYWYSMTFVTQTQLTQVFRLLFINTLKISSMSMVLKPAPTNNLRTLLPFTLHSSLCPLLLRRRDGGSEERGVGWRREGAGGTNTISLQLLHFQLI